MNAILVKAVIALIPAGLLFVRAALRQRHQGNTAGVLQLCGSACLVIVVATHIAEALRVLPFMGWGEVHSAGHYLDLTSAIFAVTLLPLGYWMARRRASI